MDTALLREFRAMAREMEDMRKFLETNVPGPALTKLKHRHAQLEKERSGGTKTLPGRAVEEMLFIYFVKTGEAGGDKEYGLQAALNHCCRLRGPFN